MERKAQDNTTLFGELLPQEAHPDSQPHLTVPNHTLIRQIGSGSYGDVWLARNAMGEWRAVKVVFQKRFKDSRPYERELYGVSRYQPISRAHPGLIHIYHFGVDEKSGYFYYVMDLGDDQTAGRIVDPETYVPKTLASEKNAHGRLSLSACLSLGLNLSTALHEIHKRGLIHRDVKPSNIVYVEGTPKLADIGMITGLGETVSYVGTEGFIPPEGPGTPKADIYSLGKVLYEACTGRDRKVFPHLPESLVDNAEMPQMRELNVVIATACETRPDFRYQTAAEMHADLVLISNGQSIYKQRKLEEKIALLRRMGLSVGVAAVLTFVIGYPLYRAKTEQQLSKQRSVGFSTAQANSRMDLGDFLGSLSGYAESLILHHSSGEDEGADRLRLGMVLAQCPRLVDVWRTTNQIKDGVFSPDGRRILIGYDSGAMENYKLEPTPTLDRSADSHTERIEAVAYSRDGKYVVTASDDKTVCVADATALKILKRITFPDIVRSANFCANGTDILAACFDGKARIYEWSTGKLQAEFTHGSGLRFAQQSHDGQWLATVGTNKKVIIWNVKTGAPHVEFEQPDWINRVDFSPDDHEIVTACNDRVARVYHVKDGSERYPEMRHLDCVFSAEFSPDGRSILTACVDGTAQLWSN